MRGDSQVADRVQATTHHLHLVVVGVTQYGPLIKDADLPNCMGDVMGLVTDGYFSLYAASAIGHWSSLKTLLSADGMPESLRVRRDGPAPSYHRLISRPRD